MTSYSSRSQGRAGIDPLRIQAHKYLTTNNAAKSLQSCLTLCDSKNGRPPGSPVPGILQARTLRWVAISFSNAWRWKVKMKSLSRVRLVATPWTSAMIISLILLISLHSDIFFPTFLPLLLSFFYSTNSHRSPILGPPCTHGADATAAVHGQGWFSPGDT